MMETEEEKILKQCALMRLWGLPSKNVLIGYGARAQWGYSPCSDQLGWDWIGTFEIGMTEYRFVMYRNRMRWQRLIMDYDHAKMSLHITFNETVDKIFHLEIYNWSELL